MNDQSPLFCSLSVLGLDVDRRLWYSLAVCIYILLFFYCHHRCRKYDLSSLPIRIHKEKKIIHESNYFSFVCSDSIRSLRAYQVILQEPSSLYCLFRRSHRRWKSAVDLVDPKCLILVKLANSRLIAIILFKA